jgi:hypothetical protein
VTKEERLLYQKERRKQTNNAYTKKYEKTLGGFIMRMYRNMKSRVSGVQKEKHHLYEGKEILSKEEFYEWALCSPMFRVLWPTYVSSGYPQKLAPTVDRKDSTKGYTLDNMEWVTHSVNSKRGAINRHATRVQ